MQAEDDAAAAEADDAFDEEIGDDAADLIDAEVIETLEESEMQPVDSDDDGEADANDEDVADDGAGPSSAAAPAAEPPPDESAVQWRSHSAAVYAVAASPAQPQLLATGGGDDRAFLWDAGTGAVHKELLGHRDTVNALGFSHDGQYLATAGLDGVVAVWNVADGSLACTLEGPSEAINWLAWHARGHVLLVGSEDTTCWMWKVPEGECMQIFAAHAASVACGAFSGDGKAIVTGADDSTVRVWSPRSGQVLHCVQVGAPAGMEEVDGAVSCLACHPASPVVLFGVADGRVFLAHLEKGTVLASWHEHAGCVEGIGFCALGGLALAASAGLDGSLCIWDTNALTLRHRCAHPDGISSLRWHPELSLVVTGGLDGVARVWDGRSGTLVRAFSGHAQGLLDVLLYSPAPGATAVVSTSDDHTARVFVLPPEAIAAV